MIDFLFILYLFIISLAISTSTLIKKNLHASMHSATIFDTTHMSPNWSWHAVRYCSRPTCKTRKSVVIRFGAWHLPKARIVLLVYRYNHDTYWGRDISRQKRYCAIRMVGAWRMSVHGSRNLRYRPCACVYANYSIFAGHRLHAGVYRSTHTGNLDLGLYSPVEWWLLFFCVKKNRFKI